MKNAQLFHNPGAGGGEHDIEEVMSLINKDGLKCHYTSVKEKGWENIKEGVEFLIIAGGDGTVKEICKMILRHNIHLPIALLPLGTANNVASSLGIKDEKIEDIISAWHYDKRIKYDTGKLSYGGSNDFFFESFGYGIFPYLITRMIKRKQKEPETPEQSMFSTLQMLEKIISSYQAVDYNILADNKDHSGRYFMTEIMLTRSIGPNLVLTPHSSLNDGLFDLVLLSENDREKFADQVSDTINEKSNQENFSTIKAKEIVINSACCDVHVDDEVIELTPRSEIKVEIMPGALEFLAL